jgi:three-Cys-motif partner protein
MIPSLSELIQEDPCPGRGVLEVGEWSLKKHELLRRYVDASWAARQRWPQRTFIDLFCGPGRVYVKGNQVQTDGGALIAWRQAARRGGKFTRVVVADLDESRVNDCAARLTELDAPVLGICGAAQETIDQVLSEVPQDGLHLAYLDPFNLGDLPFEIIQKLSRYRHIDIVVHFSVMDLQREIGLDFLRDASRFETVAPGWKNHVDVKKLSKEAARMAFVQYWLQLVKSLGFSHSKEMPLITNSRNGPLYRMMFLMRHPLADKLWNDIARGLLSSRQLF